MSPAQRMSRVRKQHEQKRDEGERKRREGTHLGDLDELGHDAVVNVGVNVDPLLERWQRAGVAGVSTSQCCGGRWRAAVVKEGEQKGKRNAKGRGQGRESREREAGYTRRATRED